MRIPKRLVPLIEEGLVDEVIRPITSGKEAEVFVVRSQGVLRAAKVYKDAQQRSFKNRSDYLDGRALRGSRGERARARGGRFAKEQEEDAWQTAELIALGKLLAAGVRVPQPRGFMEGVLLMDLVLSLDGTPAPRIADCGFTEEEARVLFEALIHEVQRMLCVGIVHGDLSEYNVLLSAYGPVIIDLPQMVDAAASQVARRLLVRDVGNIRAFCARFAPELARTRYAEEMWSLYERALLSPETQLTGQWRETTRTVDVERVRGAIAEAERDHARQHRGPPPGRGAQGGPRPPRASEPAPRLRTAPNPHGAEAPSGPAHRTARPHDAGPRPPRSHDAGPRPPRPHDAGPRPHDAGPRPPRPHDAGPRPPRPHDAGPRPHDVGPRPPRAHDAGPRPHDVGPRPPRAHDAGPRPHDAGPRPPRPHDAGPRRDDAGPRPPRPHDAGPRRDDAGPRPPRPHDAGPRPPRPHDAGPRPPRAHDAGPRPDDAGPRPLRRGPR